MVLDASAVVELLVPRATDASRLTSGDLHAPHLLDAEVAQALRRLCRTGSMGMSHGRQALADLTELAITRYDHRPLLPRVWELRDNLTAYDAMYVALAEMLDAPLVTLDARIAGAPGLRVSVEVIGSR